MPTLRPIYETSAAACRYAQVRQGHGLEILVETNCKTIPNIRWTATSRKTVKKNTPEPIQGGFSENHLRRSGYELKLDFHGQFYGVWSTRKRESCMLLLPLRIFRLDHAGVLTFILGAKNPSHATLDKTLLEHRTLQRPCNCHGRVVTDGSAC